MNDSVVSDDKVSLDRLVEDFKVVARDAEALIKATAEDLGDKAREARTRLGKSLDSAKDSFQGVENRAREGARATDQIVREHPYESIGVAFGFGLLLGLLLTR